MRVPVCKYELCEYSIFLKCKRVYYSVNTIPFCRRPASCCRWFADLKRLFTALDKFLVNDILI